MNRTRIPDDDTRYADLTPAPLEPLHIMDRISKWLALIAAVLIALALVVLYLNH